MTLIKSISGIRGTIGGKPGEGLSPVDVIKFTASYAAWLLKRNSGKRITVVNGRDARPSGETINKLVTSTLTSMGIDVIELGMATTPTVEIAVTSENADGGIIITASHNPVEWNALKLLDENGEFLSDNDGKEILSIAEGSDYSFARYDEAGTVRRDSSYNKKHIEEIIKLPLVDVEGIRAANFTVAVDCVNSVGGIILPDLLKELGVKNVIGVYTKPTGLFPHNPEPLPENLGELTRVVKENKADVGFVVDPDVDRLAIVSEDGRCFNEEYTLVACADYVLSKNKGNTVSNMSSTRALRDVTIKHGAEWFPSAVGEVNVVKMMKEKDAVIGGEGNGGIIYPPAHYGRDALAGIALFLSMLAERGKKCSQLRNEYPSYVISKNRIELSPGMKPDEELEKIAAMFPERVVSREDGVLLESALGWVQVRKSNTEAILRVYSESTDAKKADELAVEIIKIVKK
ncbi:MAG TPA: phosphoglucosamine mutase [Bacteroidales bacterium]|nr:phosphoglucosamine mutase [Bacteroidales bacterium]